jgi:hypothetical protein
MSDRSEPVAEQPDPHRLKERKFDVATFIVAGALAAFVLGAIGYGLLNGSQTDTAVPSPIMTHQAIKAAKSPKPPSKAGAATPASVADTAKPAESRNSAR